MAHPCAVLDNALRYFMNQWLNGLQPSLIIKTHFNGEIFVRSDIKFPQVKQPSLCRRKSGQNSRQRRRVLRSWESNNSETPVVSQNSEETSLSIQENTEDVSLKPNPLSPFSLPESANSNSHAEDISYAASLKPILTVRVNENFSYIPEKPKLSTTILDSVSIPPSMPKLSNLSVHSLQQTSIPLKQVFHPAIIWATLSMFGKKPNCLSAEEVDKFNSYMDWKIQCGERLEDDILYNPSGGNKNCLHCDLPTWCQSISFTLCVCSHLPR